MSLRQAVEQLERELERANATEYDLRKKLVEAEAERDQLAKLEIDKASCCMEMEKRVNDAELQVDFYAKVNSEAVVEIERLKAENARAAREIDALTGCVLFERNQAFEAREERDRYITRMRDLEDRLDIINKFTRGKYVP